MFRKQYEGHRDRGAAAVEMAIVLFVLTALVIGIIDISRIFNGEIELSQAAREGAGKPGGFSTTDVSTRTIAALTNPALQGNPVTTVTVNVVKVDGTVVTADVCTDATNFGQVTVSIPYQKIWYGPGTLTQKAVMKCAG